MNEYKLEKKLEKNLFSLFVGKESKIDGKKLQSLMKALEDNRIDEPIRAKFKELIQNNKNCQEALTQNYINYSSGRSIKQSSQDTDEINKYVESLLLLQELIQNYQSNNQSQVSMGNP